MKRERFKPPEPDDPLCCCGDAEQQRDNCCCDCDELDDTCDRWIRCEHQKPSSVSWAVAVVSERLGMPRGLLGSVRFELSVLPPMVLLPLLLRVAALHCLLGIVVLTSLPGLVLWYYYVTHRRKRRTLFFLSLALFSLAYMYYLFLTEIMPRGDVSNLQLVTVTTGMSLTLISLVRTKRGPGFVTGPSDSVSHGNDSQFHNKDSASCNGAYKSAPLVSIEKQVGIKKCPLCKLPRPPRAGHCRICGGCVLRLDHHCVWINCCVGQANHRDFLLTLLLFLLTSLYGISLVLRSVCPRQSLLTALLYCPGVYSTYSTALCFTCVWYSSIVTGGLLHLLLLQLINISYNITEREAQIALRNKTARRRFWGVVVDTGVYSKGFRHNWLQFLTMATIQDRSSLSLTDVV
ncbi:palmitoyltransferase ZDHHC23-A [Denticeps clupeoides]|uniref:Palmitoyltransferase n=1 Tax=Denticeps clupeoides TaxID=299321 RepID=A0AAY4BXB3_9TELE|nr:palmitoyltransferase ZDHHC23-like [Denticeps clupeoides]